MAIWVIAGAFGVIGALTLIFGIGRLFSGKFFSASGRTLSGLALSALGGVAGLLGLNMQTYAQLTEEQPVATLRIDQRSDGGYTAYVAFAAAGEEKDFILNGDDWRMEARIIKFKDWANVLGYDVVGRLERFDGRYMSKDDELSRDRTIYDAADFGIATEYTEIGDLYKYAKEGPLTMLASYVVDAAYGTGVYAPLADGAEYEIVLRQTGLAARPLNDAARRAAAASFRTGAAEDAPAAIQSLMSEEAAQEAAHQAAEDAAETLTEDQPTADAELAAEDAMDAAEEAAEEAIENGDAETKP